MAKIPKEPFGWLDHFRQQMDEVFRYLSTLEMQEGLDRESSPLLDIYETAADFVFEIELPGFDPDQISLRACYNTLIVSGIKSDPPRPANLNYIRLERQFGRYCRVMEIPPAADISLARAIYARGVLKVAFPKAGGKKVVVREIPVQQGE